MVITGVTGSGKSSAANFFLKRKVFKTGCGLKSVTFEVQNCVGNVGGKEVKIVDMPGLLDPTSLASGDDFTELSQAIASVPNGINALGYVVNLKERFKRGDEECASKLLSRKDLVPYAFIIFTHAKTYGNTVEEQRKWLESNNQKNLPEILQLLLKALNNRYLLIDSEEKESDYQEERSHKLFKVMQELDVQNKKPYVHKFTVVSKCIDQLDEVDKPAAVECLAMDMKTVAKEVTNNDGKNSDDNDNDDAYWSALLYYIVGAAGSKLLYVVNNPVFNFISSAVMSGTSRFYNFLRKNPQLTSEIAKTVQKLINDS